jgi:flavin reductase (DIM6/NTAB) family NADH-FMN oxidoreductase RutF
MDQPSDDRLPAELVRALDDEALDPPDQPAFLLVTTDEDGGPRISMLSVGELLVHDDQTLRVALWPGTRTVGNLGRGGTALLAAVSPGSVIYVWMRPARLIVPEDAGLECFELTVTAARADAHAGMPVTSGITFRTEDPGEAVASWRRQRELLAEARPE